MTDSPRLAEALRIYSTLPLDDGDAVLLLDDHVCLELEQLADHWDAEVRRGTARMLREASSSVVLAIARQDAELLPTDHALWRDLDEDLQAYGLDLHPLRALPAA